MKLRDLLNNLIFPLLVAFFSPILTAFGSYISTGDFRKWFGYIPKWGWIVFGGFIIFWFALILIIRRFKSIHERPTVGGISIPPWGYADIGKMQYAGVHWIIMAPRNAPWEVPEIDFTPSRIKIRTPPRCPQCGTELEQTRSFWGGYVWSCVGCGFKKRSRDSYYRVEERVERLAKREVEREI